MEVLDVLKILVILFAFGFFIYILVSSKKWCNYTYLGICLVIFILGLFLENGQAILTSLAMVILWLIVLGEKWRRGAVNF